MPGFPYVLPLCAVVLAVIAAVLIVTRRRLSTEIECPGDHQPHQVVFVGYTVDPDRWDRIESCGRDGEKTLSGRSLTCNKACLREHSLQGDLAASR